MPAAPQGGEPMLGPPRPESFTQAEQMELEPVG
jgi:hypothetical protein